MALHHLADIQFLMHDIYKKARNLEVLMKKPNMIRLIKDSNDEQIKKLSKLVRDLDREGVRRWIELHPSKTLLDKSAVELRTLGGQLQIKGASRMPREELEERIGKILNDKARVNRTDVGEDKKDDSDSGDETSS